MEELTKRQRQVLEYISRATSRQGFPPSVREIGRHFGMASTNAVVGHLRALERKGYLERQPRGPRTIRVINDRSGKFPLQGTIAAGYPIQAFENPDTIRLEDAFAGDDHFLLQVRGDSMIEDQIADGDWVVVEPRSTAHDGEIVVALLDDEEATLKRFYREKDCIRLEPANSSMTPLRVAELKIQGVVVGLIRRYK